jgi:malonyl-CoA decarboxylase
MSNTEETPESRHDPGSYSQNPLSRAFGSVMDAGRVILARRRQAASGEALSGSLAALCRELLDHRGEASGLALAGEITGAYAQLSEAGRLAFFESLAREFDVDRDQVLAAAEAYRENPGIDRLWEISRAVEAPRQKLFRRLNTAPDGTRTLVAMRGHLLRVLKGHAELRGVDADLRQLFISWFNKGFLELRRMDWSSPALELEKLIDYAAVHQIKGWDDLRSRLREDRRCFAFFHPAMAHDPVVFVEVALADSIPDSIEPLLQPRRLPVPGEKVNTVVFYAISNCHPGLAGVSFGNFLIKSVVEELKRELPGLKTFVTLSPVPGFRRWLATADLTGLVEERLESKVRAPVGRVVESELEDALVRLCAHYLLKVKSGRYARDPVARFHLGNGARLHALHWAADLSPKGREQSAGIMVNYLYDLARIEVNHEAYFDSGRISASRAVTRLLD